MNKGFKALPEHVQRKIDPELAKKFEDGGAVMGRPLFQQGVNELSIAPGFGGAGGNHPIFKSLGIKLGLCVKFVICVLYSIPFTFTSISLII